MNYKTLFVSIIVNGFSPARENINRITHNVVTSNNIDLSESCRWCYPLTTPSQRRIEHQTLSHFHAQDHDYIKYILEIIDGIEASLEEIQALSTAIQSPDNQASNVDNQTIILSISQRLDFILTEYCDFIKAEMGHIERKYTRVKTLQYTLFFLNQISSLLIVTYPNENNHIRNALDPHAFVQQVNSSRYNMHQMGIINQYMPTLIAQLSDMIAHAHAVMAPLYNFMGNDYSLNKLSESLQTILPRIESLQMIKGDDYFDAPSNQITPQHAALINQLFNQNIETIRARMERAHTYASFIVFRCITHMLISLGYITDAKICELITTENNQEGINSHGTSDFREFLLFIQHYLTSQSRS